MLQTLREFVFIFFFPQKMKTNYCFLFFSPRKRRCLRKCKNRQTQDNRNHESYEDNKEVLDHKGGAREDVH